MEFRIRPKSNYLHQANWEALYLLTEHWQSDMDYYRDELHFLRDLLSKYFIWLTKDDNISHVQSIANRLTEATKERDALSAEIKEHLRHIEALMENRFSHDEQQFRDEHAVLEETLADFNKMFRILKKEIFSASELVIESEKLQHLLTK